MRGGKRSVPPLSAFFCKKESLAKKMNRRAAPLSRLDRRFFEKKALQKTQWKNTRWFFLFLGWFGSAGCRPPYPSVLIRTHPYTGCRSPRHKQFIAPLRCRGLIDAFLEKSFAKKLNRVTPSTTYVCNMLSICTGNRAIILIKRLAVTN